MEKIVKIKKVNLSQKLTKVSDYWSPKVIAQMNNYHFKLAKVKDEFIWHKHEETDETFFVIKGQLTIQLRDGEIIINEGEMVVIPKNVEHKPLAAKECHIMLIEPRETVNTGNVEDEMTVKKSMDLIIKFFQLSIFLQPMDQLKLKYHPSHQFYFLRYSLIFAA